MRRHASWQAFVDAVQPDQTRMFAFTTRGSRPFAEVAWQPGDWLVFGCETRGLPADVLDMRSDLRPFRIVRGNLAELPDQALVQKDLFHAGVGIREETLEQPPVGGHIELMREGIHLAGARTRIEKTDVGVMSGRVRGVAAATATPRDASPARSRKIAHVQSDTRMLRIRVFARDLATQPVERAHHAVGAEIRAAIRIAKHHAVFRGLHQRPSVHEESLAHAAERLGLLKARAALPPVSEGAGLGARDILALLGGHPVRAGRGVADGLVPPLW